MKKIVGTVETIRYQSDDGYTVADFSTQEGVVTVVGNMINCYSGTKMELEVSETEHSRYGKQYRVKKATNLTPPMEQGIIGFLSSGAVKGIGPKIAAAIVGKFSAETFDIIEKNPERLLEVEGIGSQKAKAICESLKGDIGVGKTMAKLVAYGIGSAAAGKVCKIYGEEALGVIEENPYILIQDVEGIGFKTADEIARKMGIEGDDENRICHGVLYKLGQLVKEGHTYYPRADLCEEVGLMLEVERESVDDCLIRLAFDGNICIEAMDDVEGVFLTPYYVAERAVSGKLAAMASVRPEPIDADVGSLIDFTEREMGISFSKEQRGSIVEALDNGVSVVTGGPGTGKTTMIRGILNILTMGGKRILVAAPTGRAAKRITETTGYEAKTIHRMLEYNYCSDSGTMRFGKNEEDPLECDAVIIDEASMVDLMLMNSLTKAIPHSARLILVGDVDQLPPVGAGAVLKEMMESQCIFVAKLEEIFRQAKESLIVVNAHRINRGEAPCFNDREKDFFLIEREHEGEIEDTLVDLCCRRLPEYFGCSRHGDDIQLITPTRKGRLGTVNLNKRMQEALNGQDVHNVENVQGVERIVSGKVFRLGDKVMQTKNNYTIKWKHVETFQDGEGVFNGDMGIISSVDNSKNTISVIFDGKRVVTYDGDVVDELDHAYAITVHKSQGSEFPIIVMPMDRFPPMLATRNLLYTGITRGKKAVVLVGKERAANSMVENNPHPDRHSGLGLRIKRLMYD